MALNNISKSGNSENEDRSAAETAVSKSFIQKLKVKWGLQSVFQVIIVLLVFSVTGTTVVYLREILFSSLGFDSQTPFWLKTITYILFVFPAYQALILCYGSLFGQFEFFWNKEKKLFKAIKRLFVKK